MAKGWLTIIVVPTQNISQVNGYGYPLAISISTSLAKNSVRDSWVLTRSYVRQLLCPSVLLCPGIYVYPLRSMSRCSNLPHRPLRRGGEILLNSPLKPMQISLLKLRRPVSLVPSSLSHEHPLPSSSVVHTFPLVCIICTVITFTCSVSVLITQPLSASFTECSLRSIASLPVHVRAVSEYLVFLCY